MADQEQDTRGEEVFSALDVPTLEVGDEPAPARGGAGSRHKVPAMRTVLAHFCEQLELNVRPLLGPIKTTRDALAAAQALPTQAMLPALRDLSDQIALLADKMAEQQAYVLIFGPLKSGKSTFMNAICAKYVSEVTCLPAYPCLVQVAHADEARFVVTRYNGETETFTEQERLRRAVASDHRDLVDTIRRCEQDEVDFEPQRHAPHAIRRIDVRVPAGDLAQSSAVLVDTPGLYSRMKFGYDRMTREFRNAAACAIFVVKTDNLFLDQVFDEFQDLLELFSRIFLIVNLDAAKQDLKPDGSLVPSLEHEDPHAVVQAFENLSMSAALKAAREDGRLRIYPVDLLGAASRRIRTSQAGDGRGAIEDEPRGQADFDVLLRDLTDYLNSNEYLKAFVNDSLRRAHSLLDELSQALRAESVQQLEREAEALTREQEELGERSRAIERLGAIDWAQRMAAPREALQEAVRAEIEPLRRNAANALNGALDAWFEDDTSLRALREGDAGSALAHCRDDCLRLVREELQRRLVREGAGSDLPAEVRRDFDTAGVDPGEAARDALGELELEGRLAVPEWTLASERIPVRRGLLDWLLLRSRAAVRKRLFGPAGDPDTPIPPNVKAKRLGERARERMRELFVEMLDPLAEQAAQALPREAGEAYVSALSQRLARSLAEAGTATRERLDAVGARRDQAHGVLARIDALRRHTTQVSQAIVGLEEHFGEMDPDELRRWVASPARDVAHAEP